VVELLNRLISISILIRHYLLYQKFGIFGNPGFSNSVPFQSQVDERDRKKKEGAKMNNNPPNNNNPNPNPNSNNPPDKDEGKKKKNPAPAPRTVKRRKKKGPSIQVKIPQGCISLALLSISLIFL
jgi:hypothetical protein